MKRLIVAVLLGALLWVAPYPRAGADVNPWVTLYEHSLFIVGDSLTYDMVPYVPSTWPGRDVLVDCWPGINIGLGDQLIAWREAMPPLSRTAVVALGGNDTEPLWQFMWMVEGTIDMLPAGERVYWVNGYSLRDRTWVDKNAIIEFVAAHHTNVSVIDWASVISRYPGLIEPDGVHYVPAGYGLRAQTIAAAVGS